MKLIKLVLGLVFAVYALTPASATQPRFFAGIAGVMTPLLDYKLRGEIDAQKASSLEHYRATFDLEGRPLAIQYFSGEKPSSNSYFQAHEVRYNYEPGRMVRSYYGVDGQPMAMWRHYYQTQNVQKEEYVRSGNIVELHMYGVGGDRVSVGTDAFVFRADHSDPRGFIQTQFKKDGTPAPIFQSMAFYRFIITEDENGFQYQVLNLGSEGAEVRMQDSDGFAEFRLNFDQYGNELGWDYRDENGDLVNRIEDGRRTFARWIYEKDWTDRPLGQFRGFVERYETASGQPYCKDGIVCSVKRRYAPYPRMTLQVTLGENDEPVVDPAAGFAIAEIQYDQSGRRSEVRYSDAAGNLVSQGVAIRRYQYDDEGKVSMTAFDHSGKHVPVDN